MPQRTSLYFTGNRSVVLRDEPLAEPSTGQLAVSTRMSLVSAGTEGLIFRGEAPLGDSVDASLPAYAGQRFQYPMKYGYACIGEVTAVGDGVDDDWRGRSVLAWQPHESAFVLPVDQVLDLSSDAPRVAAEDALFVPLLETAITLCHDLNPRLGETVAVTGLGMIGLLTAAMLVRQGIETLVLLDPDPARLAAVKRLLPQGESCDVIAVQTGEDGYVERACETLAAENAPRADATLELSGTVDGLNDALALTGDRGRMVLGSWYGSAVDGLQLGTRFHRSRIRLQASQVSTLAPELSGRWSVSRRRALALEWAARLKPSRLISHRIPFQNAARAYEVLENPAEPALAVVFTY